MFRRANVIRLVGFRVVQALSFDVLQFRDVYGELTGGLDKLRLGSVESLWIRRDLCLQSSTPSSADEFSLSRLLNDGSGSHEVWKEKGKEEAEGTNVRVKICDSGAFGSRGTFYHTG